MAERSRGDQGEADVFSLRLGPGSPSLTLPSHTGLQPQHGLDRNSMKGLCPWPGRPLSAVQLMFWAWTRRPQEHLPAARLAMCGSAQPCCRRDVTSSVPLMGLPEGPGVQAGRVGTEPPAGITRAFISRPLHSKQNQGGGGDYQSSWRNRCLPSLRQPRFL